MRTPLSASAFSLMLLLAACGSGQQESGAGAEPATDQEQQTSANAESGSAGALQPVDNSARAPSPNGSAGGKANDDTMRWTFSSAAGTPKVAFGEPQTDNVRLMLRCPESGQALLSFIRPAEIAEDRPDTLEIASGGSTRSLTLETQQGPLGTTVAAEAPLSAGPLQQFRSGQGLEVRWGEETISVPGASDGQVGQFFDACS